MRPVDLAWQPPQNSTLSPNDAHPVAVFLTEERDGAQFLGLFYRHVAVVLQGQVFADFGIDDAFHFAQLFVGHFLEVGEVEAQVFRGDQ